ncbi:hypothetical protein HTSR_2012 [Halodesulfurarchaeum formicicum]|uniref:Uncharacterized protein n=1 Tax=Halodesulfurarchaeum formicicum TaxID=1873524 RepID=A0A1D8S738_9EURY|nr:DUF6757 family protein [Halodesulfurarchaeum formicicum]AOW81173.1 hypothetical protein HTSR_2012 [Halodesulfurarchaeum formicicum]APE96516.1 hypothetical protein HSR6_2088 [Halodesulfurarchaeum formicicum]
MECHYCGRTADVTVESDGVRVGLCEDHFKERLEELSESAAFEDLQDELDIDRA